MLSHFDLKESKFKAAEKHNVLGIHEELGNFLMIDLQNTDLQAAKNTLNSVLSRFELQS